MKRVKKETDMNEDSFIVEDTFVKYNVQKDFTSRDARKKARLVKLFFYEEVIPFLPVEEKYNLNLQIRKASVSGTANISEGYGRYHYQEGVQFCRISRGSIYELKDHIISCFDFGFVSNEIFEKGISLIEDAKVTLNGYIRFVFAQKNTSSL